MRGAVGFLLSLFLAVQHVSSFSVPDTFHLMQTAATHLSHTLPMVAPEVKHQVAQNSHHFNLLESYKQLLSAHPLPTKMATGATLAVCGDAIAQSQDESSEYDKRRAASFAAFDYASAFLVITFRILFRSFIVNCLESFRILCRKIRPSNILKETGVAPCLTF